MFLLRMNNFLFTEEGTGLSAVLPEMPRKAAAISSRQGNAGQRTFSHKASVRN